TSTPRVGSSKINTLGAIPIHLPSTKDFIHHGLFDDKTATTSVKPLPERLNVKATDEEQMVGSLSGGNQQKVVLAK
ncbi:hypothetical protein PTA92_24345, partial [Shigella sonnei]|nr:hypothetical protein [Shigella sonnei]